ncbi:MAG TPA: single-stranded-DNA-specific exonuclease RecJ [Patescibacteria group bacterium]
MKLNLGSETIIDKSFSADRIVSLLLNHRGLTPETIADFLDPPHPKSYTLADYKIDEKLFAKAVSRIRQAIEDKQNILIYGDYDVDGITSTAILWCALYEQLKSVTPFVPDRELDGYGIRAASFFRLEKEKDIKFDLLITVDNGIVAAKELQKIKDSGTDIIVCDHHVADGDMSKVVSGLVHSTLVSGAALSWLLAKEFDPDADLGLAALGAVADCMPLVGVNRSLVVHGLRSLRLQPPSGLKKLFQVSGLKQDSLSSYDLGFVIGPRINAVGRLSNPMDALRLLCSPTTAHADKFARILDNFNHDRQVLQQDSLDLVDDLVKNIKDKIIVVAHESFHPGIIGLIAGRLTEKYYLPSVVIAKVDGYSKGSCRSVPEINIIETLRQFNDLFIDLGGHVAAAGFSIENSNIPKLKKKLIETVNKKLADTILEPNLSVEAQMKLGAVSVKNVNAIRKLEPFGIGNSEPLFLFKGVQIVSKRLLGQQQNHLKLKVDDPSTKFPENVPCDAIAFKKGSLDGQLKVGDTIDLVASLDLNTWNGITTPQLIVKEIIK